MTRHNGSNPNPNYKRLLSIDPSLTCSGWAMFTVGGKQLIAAGKIRCLGPEKTMAKRLLDLQEKVVSVYDQFELGETDVLICEAPTTMRDPRAMLQVEQVRGIFEALGRSRKVNVPGRVNPRSVQYEMIGLKGKQLERSIVKSSAVHAVQALYSTELRELGIEPSSGDLEKHQDVVDAILVGAYALNQMSHAFSAGIALDKIFEERTRRSS